MYHVQWLSPINFPFLFPGKCNKGDECPYIHDPDKIAVCTK